jgi:hypothetical protein
LTVVVIIEFNGLAMSILPNFDEVHKTEIS